MSLFVPEEEEVSQNSNEDGPRIVKPEDPIVEEIPLYLNHMTDSEHDICLFQYISQLSSKPLTNNKGIQIPACRVKPESQMVEIDVPLDTARFFDKQKSDEWSTMTSETYGGNLLDSRGTYIMGIQSNPITGKREIVLTPINKTAQIRPVFHHIDTHNEVSKDGEVIGTTVQEAPKKAPAKNNVQVVQMTAKNIGSENEIRYSEAIQSFKKFQSEDFVESTWFDESDENSTKLKEKLYGDEELKSKVLEVTESEKDYINKLLNDKLVLR